MIYLKDYQKPNHTIAQVYLQFTIQKNIDPQYGLQVLVDALLDVQILEQSSSKLLNPLILHGKAALQHLQVYTAQALNFKEITDFNHTLNQLTPLTFKHYINQHRHDANLSIEAIEASNKHFYVHTQVLLNPEDNTELMGLFASNGRLFTQCEPEGFRKITYFPDRPDIQSLYTVQIIDQTGQFKQLLSNGHLIKQGINAQNNSYAIWHDPFAKPCYLFALVAGNFACLEHTLNNYHGRDVLLQVYVDEADLDKANHAMQSLIKSIEWDEKTFNLPLDLDRFMIVATQDFNMGAMENKGLNIFNAKYVLANPMIATDMDYMHVESVVAHEYFHNWTGNRVTCRDWFQLSLKEGLTVLRDQWFSEDVLGKSIRLDSIETMLCTQFNEDASSMAHPIQPQMYQEINNFYTATVYEKGAEVVRMYKTILGEEGFKQGMQRYISQHDGSAATCLDFYQAMLEANLEHQSIQKLNQFANWYQQIGTPKVDATIEFKKNLDLPSPHNHEMITVNFEQHTQLLNEDGQQISGCVCIPINWALLHQHQIIAQGTFLLQQAKASLTIELSPALKKQFNLDLIDENDLTLSLLRGFSAPVLLSIEPAYNNNQLMHLVKASQDPYQSKQAIAQWWQNQLMPCLIDLHTDYANQDNPEVLSNIIKDYLIQFTKMQPNFLNTLLDLWQYANNHLKNISPSQAYLLASLLDLPSKSSLMQAYRQYKQQASTQNIELLAKINPKIFILLLQHLFKIIASHANIAQLSDMIYDNLYQTIKADYHYEDLFLRSLQTIALKFASYIQPTLAENQFAQAKHLSNQISAIQALQSNPNLAEQILKIFYTKCSHPLLLDKWFTLAAQYSGSQNTLAIDTLIKNSNFNHSPNRFRSLIFNYILHNINFHTQAGYQLWHDLVLELDQNNPQLAARLTRLLEDACHYSPVYANSIKKYLQNLQVKVQSNDMKEIIAAQLLSFI